MLKRKFTPINEAARAELNISRDEYAFCSYVLYRQADPRQKIKGYCCDSKEELSVFVGITRAGIYKMIDRMLKANLMEVDATNGYLSATAYFMDVENDCKLSLQSEFLEKEQSVNLVDNDCKLSLHQKNKSVNLVTPIIGIEGYNSKNDKEGYIWVKNENKPSQSNENQPYQHKPDTVKAKSTPKDYSKQSQVERLRSVWQYAKDKNNTAVLDALALKEFRDLWTEYILYRTKTVKKKYKTVLGEYTKIANFVEISTLKVTKTFCLEKAKGIFKQTELNEWEGLFPIKPIKDAQQQSAPPTHNTDPQKGIRVYGGSYPANL